MEPRPGAAQGLTGGRWGLVVPALALLLALVQLGPALTPGVVLTYDLSVVPGGGFTPFTLGAGVPAPRAVPSDAVVALLGSVVPVQVVQKVLLVALLAGAGTGAARLLAHLLRSADRAPSSGVVLVAQLVVVPTAQWNPFVTERLVLGQWTVLLGVAVLPWALRAALRSPGAGVLPVAGWLLLACLGGANTVLLVVPPVLVLAAWALRGRPAARRRVGGLLLVVVGGCAPWAVPALAAAPQAAGEASTTAFVARSDTAAGLLATLVAGGGVWNPAVVPPGRSVLLVGVVSALVVALVGVLGGRRLARLPGGTPLLALGAVSLLLVVVQAWGPTAPVVASLLGAVPGGGLLRDGQKLLAWWVVVVACCAGALAAHVLERVPHPARTALVVLLAAAPVAVLPAAAWGSAARLDAVPLPPAYQELRAAVRAEPAGAAGSLPWGQYRRYPWNASRVSLDVLPRLLDRRVVQDDSLPLRDARVPGEDPVAARVSADLAAGADPFAALADEGVGLVVVDRASGADLVAGLAQVEGAVVVHESDVAVLVRLPVPDGATGPSDRVTGPGRAGWALGLLTLGGTAVAAAVAVVRRTPRRDAVGSPPTEG